MSTQTTQLVLHPGELPRADVRNHPRHWGLGNGRGGHALGTIEGGGDAPEGGRWDLGSPEAQGPDPWGCSAPTGAQAEKEAARWLE